MSNHHEGDPQDDPQDWRPPHRRHGVAAARLLYHNHNLYIRLVSAYLNDQLRPLITDRVGEPRLLGWNERSAQYQRGPQRSRLTHAAGLALLFPVPAAVALVLVMPWLASPWTWLAWSSGWLLLLAQVVLTNRPGLPGRCCCLGGLLRPPGGAVQWPYG